MNSYIPLDTVKIASPCSTSWDAMEGTDRVRHCSECSLSVYNISEMTRQEAETLITGAEGRLCIRMYQRADGTIITNDCPVGVQAFRLRVARKVRTITAAALTFVGGVLGVNTARSAGGDIMGKMAYQEVETVADTTTTKIAPVDTLTVPDDTHIVMMGGMMAPPPPTAPEPVNEPVEEPTDERIYEVMGEMSVSVEPVDTVDKRPTMVEPENGIIDYTSFPAGTIIQGIEPAVTIREAIAPIAQPLPAVIPVQVVEPLPVDQPLPTIEHPPVAEPGLH